MKEFPTWLVVLAVIIMVINAFALFFPGSSDAEVTVDFSEQNARLDSLEVVVQGLTDAIEEPEEEGAIEPGSFMLSKSEFEDAAIETEALVLATESVESRDFRKAVYIVLLGLDVDIDSYKDIIEVVIKDTDVDENEVKFSVKIYYFLDGDEDETERARLVDFTVVVDDLDFDDDFEDAEVNENYLDTLEVLKVYE